MNRFLKLTWAAALVVVLAGCSGHAASTGEEIKKTDFQGSYKHYESLEELVLEADAVAEVEILEQQTEVINEMPITTSTAAVRDVLKGSLAKKDIIAIHELGGVYYPHLNGDPSQPRTKEPYEMTFEGVGAMKPNDKQVVFLVLDDERNDGSYTIFALHQGKFKITGDKVDRGIKDEKEAFKFKSLNDLKEEIKSIEVDSGKQSR